MCGGLQCQSNRVPSYWVLSPLVALRPRLEEEAMARKGLALDLGKEIAEETASEVGGRALGKGESYHSLSTYSVCVCVYFCFGFSFFFVAISSSCRA